MPSRYPAEVTPKRQDQRAWAALSTGAAVLLLVSPARQVWAHPQAPWWSPFLLWCGLIVCGVWIARQDG